MKQFSMTLSCLTALALLAFSGMQLAVFADDGEPEWTPVEVQEAGHLVRDKAVVASLPEGQFFADGEALVAWWEAMDWDFSEKPDVDFRDSILVIEYRDAADPNEVMWGGRLSSEGELELGGMSTLMGYEPSDEVRLEFLVVPREGVVALARDVQKVDDEGQVTFERVVYPIDDE